MFSGCIGGEGRRSGSGWLQYTKVPVFLLLALILVSDCRLATGVRLHDPENPPHRLSDWGLLIKTRDSLKLADGSFAYHLETPLFSDHAQKLRTLWMPEGTQARDEDGGVFTFPPGSIISKTFFFPIEDGHLVAVAHERFDAPVRALDTSVLRLIETRLLVHGEDGWVAIPYLWNEAQDEALLSLTGSLQALDVRTPEGDLVQASYLVPSRNQCASCHQRRNSGGIHPIGPKAWNLDIDFWLAGGHLESRRPASEFAPLAASPARRYLDVNCAHCHSEEGAGDTSGLFLALSEMHAVRLGICKPSVAAGPGTGGHRYSIEPGAPEDSILAYRMRSVIAAEMMPELGRSLVDEAGVRLIEDWISAMPGSCD